MVPAERLVSGMDASKEATATLKREGSRRDPKRSLRSHEQARASWPFSTFTYIYRGDKRSDERMDTRSDEECERNGQRQISNNFMHKIEEALSSWSSIAHKCTSLPLSTYASAAFLLASVYGFYPPELPKGAGCKGAASAEARRIAPPHEVPLQS